MKRGKSDEKSHICQVAKVMRVFPQIHLVSLMLLVKNTHSISCQTGKVRSTLDFDKMCVCA